MTASTGAVIGDIGRHSLFIDERDHDRRGNRTWASDGWQSEPNTARTN
jgi:hypothetical protein